MFRGFVCALQFLTILPVGRSTVWDEKELGQSMLFYPAAGLCVGLGALGCYKISAVYFPPSVSMVIAFVCGIALTGGLHIDGFADMCDGFYAGKDKSQILAVMKDPHVGTMAVIGVFCLLALKLSLYFSLMAKERVTETFLIAPAAGRWAMAVMASRYPYARSEGTARPFINNVGLRESATATILMGMIGYWLMGVQGLGVCAGGLAVSFLFVQWASVKISGITGDILGAVNEITEVSVLVLAHFAAQPVHRTWLS